MRSFTFLAVASLVSADESCDISADEATLLQVNVASREMDTVADEQADVMEASTGLPGAPQYIGCFTDNRRRDMGRWLGNRDNAATNTFAGCASACDKAYMSLQSGGECFCSDSYGGDGYNQVDDSQCGPVGHINANCASNSHSCGGHWRNAVFRNPGQGAEHYIGCFTDNRRRDMGRWLGNRDNAATNTFAGCAGACDKAFLSMQSGGECFCSDSYGGDGYNQVDDSQCGPVDHINANCASNSHSCGGHWRNAVFRNPRAGQGAEHYIGCFTDNRRRDMGTWLGNRDNAATNTFAGCAGACDKAYMSLQSGGECFCSDSYGGDGYNQVDDSQCGPVDHINANCASNSFSCGGHWRNAVFRTPGHASLLQAGQEVVQEDFEEEEEEMDFETDAEESVTDWSTDSAGRPGAAQYIGCFTDNRQRDMGNWLGNRDNAATNTFEGCRAACNSRYLALQSGGECFCSDRYATSSSYRQVADSECNTNSNQRCSSNSHNCGGHWRQAIYHNRAGFNFGAIGANTCPGGGNVGEADCLAAAQGLLARGQSQGRRHLVAGSWGWVPPGCSIQTHRTHGQAGDFAAHFNRGRGRNDGGYTPVCNTGCQVLRNQDVVAGTFAHYGRDHGGAATDEACSAACTADAECTAWVRQPSSGRCWISRQSVVTFEADRDRNTGLRCN